LSGDERTIGCEGMEADKKEKMRSDSDQIRPGQVRWLQKHRYMRWTDVVDTGMVEVRTTEYCLGFGLNLGVEVVQLVWLWLWRWLAANS